MLRFLLLLIWMAGGSGGAVGATVALHANTAHIALAPHVEILEDEGGRLTVADVSEGASAAMFRPTGLQSEEINRGYTASAFWLRMTLAAANGAGDPWLLEVAFPSLDSVELFGPNGEHWRTGDLLPFDARPIPNRNFLFPISLRGEQAQTFYLRVASAGTLTVPLHLWRPERFERHNQNVYALIALYYGILIALMLYNMMLFFSIRDSVYLTYVGFVASMAIGQLSLNGLGNEYLWPNWPTWGNAAFPTGFAATGFFGALFTRGFLQTRRTVPQLDAVLLALIALFAFCALAPLFLPYRYAAIQTSMTGVIFSFVAVLTGIRCQSRGHAGARWFLLAWALLLVGVGILGLRNMGWLPTTPFTTYAMQVGSALEMIMLSFALANRINILQSEKEAAQADALAAKHAAVEVLENAERDLERRIAERTRLLEEANARLRENERQLQETAHSDPLTGLANRLLLDARLDQAMQSARRHGGRVGVMLIDLDRFKPINDQYGHAIGDEVLREVAERLRKVVREVDTVARLGGDEFVVVLTDVNAEDAAVMTARKVVGEMERPFRVLGLPLELGASVGLALYNGSALTVAELLRQADHAMYEAKAAGRGCMRLYAVS